MTGDLGLARLLFTLGLLAGLTTAMTRAEAQEFSADLVTLDATGRPAGLNGKVFVSGRNVRIETADVPGGFFVVNGADDAAYLVKPGQRVYMDAKQSSRLTQLLVPVDPRDPCRKWQAMAKLAGAADAGGQWRCKGLGPDSVAKRDVLKYAATSPQGEPSTGWIDPKLGFLIRLLAEDGSGLELENISEGPQPPSRFEIPTGYRKFDPLRLIEQMKKSDVWVEPPQE